MHSPASDPSQNQKGFHGMAEQPPYDDSANATGTTRRDVIRQAAGLAGVAAVGATLPRHFAQAATTSLPDPASSGIDHIVVLMMENRSFDHMLGWLPGANGVQAGRTFLDNDGAPQTSHLLTKFQNCSSSDPDHSFGGGRTQLNGGAMDGFLKTAKVGDTFPIGYFSAADVPFFANAARYWTICDNYHCSILGPTWPNRFYMHSGQTDRLTTGGNTIDTNSLLSILSPTVWDLAANAGVNARYYFSDSAFTALWGDKYTNISFPLAQFKADAAAGNLPAISFVDPSFSGEGAGTSNDDHPLADIRNGQVLMNTIYQALSTSPNWANTLFIINYDEWGGFADHVVPPLAPVSAHEVKVGNVDTPVNADGTASAFLGFRVPCLLIGPRARRGSIASTLYDATSILNLISWRFGLPGLGIRATTSNNIASALNFSGPANTALPPPVNLVNQVYGGACATNPMADLDLINKEFAGHFADIEKVADLMARHGFKTA
jgi:phospholipase C